MMPQTRGYYFHKNNNTIIVVMSDDELADTEAFTKELLFCPNWIKRFIEKHGKRVTNDIYEIDATIKLILEKIDNLCLENFDKTKRLINQIPINTTPKAVLKILKAYESLVMG